MGTIVVTGASTGIGRACAERLARDGHAVIAGVRKEADAEALRAAHPAIEPAIVDVTKPEQVAALGARIDGLPLHGLVNNAGMGVGGPLEFVALGELRRQFEVNVVGQVAVTQALLEALRRARGRVVFMGSVGGRVPAPFLGPYQGSKGAIRQLAGSLRQELRPWGVHVALIEPGAVSTPIWSKAGGEFDATMAAMPERGRELYGRRLGRIPELLRKQDAAGVPPAAVAAAVAHALTAGRPRAIYTVGRDARAQKALQALLPTPAFDALVRRLSGLGG